MIIDQSHLLDTHVEKRREKNASNRLPQVTKKTRTKTKTKKKGTPFFSPWPVQMKQKDRSIIGFFFLNKAKKRKK